MTFICSPCHQLHNLNLLGAVVNDKGTDYYKEKNDE